MKNRWVNGSGNLISFEELMDNINSYVSSGGKIFIGTDSQVKNNECILVTAICLHGKFDKFYATYFFNRQRLDLEPYKILRSRIMKEVQSSVDIAMDIIERYPDVDIEVHVDVGATQKSATHKFVDSISGWIKGIGLQCKIKPYSWASSSVADSHTK